MKSKILLFGLFLFAGLINTENVFAQDEEQTEETHAHSTRLHWKGINVNTVLGNSDYEETGKKIFLYNVGTGRFVIEGGNWGMEGRLFHETFGRAMFLMSDGYIKSGITEQSTDTKVMFGCNVPKVSKPNANWSDYKKYSFTVMMDADQQYLSPWTFQRVETDPDADTYTYYLWERMPKKKPTTNYYLGAAWGEWHVAEDKGDGQFIYLDGDRSCWTTGSVIGNQEMMDVDGDLISVDELYQWRLIPEDEFVTMLNEATIGPNPSVSSLIPDRDFCRNDDNFESKWVMETKDGVDYTQLGRRGFTYGIYQNKKQQAKYYPNDAWNKPVRLKNNFDSYGTMEDKLKNSKFGFLSFEGVGRAYTSFEVPRAGWYEIQCYGFVQSDEGHDAYLFAKLAGSTSTSSYGGESKIDLHKVPAGTYTNKNIADSCLVVGKELTYNGSNYKNTVWICIPQDMFDAGYKTLQIGVGKDEATSSAGEKSGGKWYYYDTDWVCVDDFRATYMGLGPVFFYEDEEDLDYLIPGENNHKQYMSSTPDGKYSGATCLERSLKKDQWNSFSFPLPLTGEQMRLAFGEDAKLAKIHSIGKLSQNPDVIDFQSISLRTTDYVVEPGQFYLLCPTADPTPGKDPQGNLRNFYELGRMFFTINPEAVDETFPLLPLDTMKVDNQEISSLEGQNDGVAHVNYVRTSGFTNFTPGTSGSNVANGVYAPDGAYVVSDNTIYHINKDTRLKGFRGWITLAHPIPPSGGQMTMALFGMFYNGDEGTSIGEMPTAIQLPDDTAVYDLSGRKVGTIGMHLSKGLYIVNGKKFFIK